MFYGFFIIFFRKFGFKKIHNTRKSQIGVFVLEKCSHELHVANIVSKCDGSNALSFRDVTFVVSFLKLFEELRYE